MNVNKMLHGGLMIVYIVLVARLGYYLYDGVTVGFRAASEPSGALTASALVVTIANVLGTPQGDQP